MEEVENERATIRMVREHLDVMLAKEKEANDRHAEAARHMAVMDAKLSTTKTTLEQKQQELAGG
jgi:TATA-binding protein-associated factor Taf7